MLINKIKNIKDQPKNALYAAFILIVFIATYNWIIVPRLTYLSAVQKYRPVIGNIANENQTKSNTVRTKKQQLDELQARVKELHEALYTTEQAKQFMGNLQNTVAASGCTMNSLSFSEQSAGRTIGLSNDTIEITARSATLRIKGAYDGIEKLVEELQQQTKKVKIETLDIDVNNPLSGILECTMTVTIYVLKE